MCEFVESHGFSLSKLLKLKIAEIMEEKKKLKRMEGIEDE